MVYQELDVWVEISMRWQKKADNKRKSGFGQIRNPVGALRNHQLSVAPLRVSLTPDNHLAKSNPPSTVAKYIYQGSN